MVIHYLEEAAIQGFVRRFLYHIGFFWYGA